MPGPGDFLFNLLAGDPRRQLAMALGQGPGQSGGPPADPSQPAPPPSPPAGGAGPQQQQQPSQQGPQAYQSPPDMQAMNQRLQDPNQLMNIMLQMQQRDRATEQFNRGLGMMAAAFSPPRDRATMINAMSGMGGDANADMGSLMRVYQMQYQMNQQRAFAQSLPGLSQTLGIPADQLYALGPDMVREMLEKSWAAKQPTDEARTIQWEHDKFIEGGGTEEGWKPILQSIISRGMVGGNDPMFQTYRQERDAATAQGKTDFPDYPTWQANKKAEAEGQQKIAAAQADAKTGFDAYNNGLSTLRDKVANIFSNEDTLKKVVHDPWLINQVKQAREGKSTWDAIRTNITTAGYDDDAISLANDVLDVSDEDYRKQFTNKATAANQGEAANISSALDGLKRVGSSSLDQYKKMGQDALNQIDTARAGAYGASGQLAIMPKELRQRLGPAYMVGGAFGPKTAKPIDPGDLAALKQAIANNPEKRVEIIQDLKARWYDTTPLES